MQIEGGHKILRFAFLPDYTWTYPPLNLRLAQEFKGFANASNLHQVVNAMNTERYEKMRK